MRKSIIAVLAASVLGVAGYLTLDTAVQAEEVTLYKNPQCGCCEGYADYLRENGFDVTVEPTHELVPMSRSSGIPDGFQGCHLAFIDDYVVSGHVPVATIDRLLAERPGIKGITLPGMPQGSPGMSGVKTGAFEIYAIGDGAPHLYATK
ncbi:MULTISPECIES: DUF411 domain-containing protein [Thalassobaculum]|uniref:Uncharacterized conserved protein n=1 Tax=Thalassobaculum litoreum DSM 18839 TaxID=1123362 RepID=A0A8G2BMG3_9PROT|nr:MULTISPECIES: DUF411 domain-containing protein [Thalassobaculum]SDG54308.1 Uncharacterized conserved protein [Thalassobaculum litoreum DSM 18839]